MWRLKSLLAMAPFILAGCFGSDPEHTEYFPEVDGDKPDLFEIGFVEVCQGDPAAIHAAARFATQQGMSKHNIADPGERVVAAYTFGLPMRAHLMVERLYVDRYRVAVSTFRGYPTELVVAAHNYSFCGVNSAPSSNSFKPNPLRGSA